MSSRSPRDVRTALVRASQTLYDFSTESLNKAETLMHYSEQVAGVAARGTDEQCKALLDDIMKNCPECIPN